MREPKHPLGVTIRIHKGHGHNHALFVESTSSGKAQFLEVSLRQCTNSGITPLEVASSVKRALQSHVVRLSSPVRSASWPPDLRARANHDNQKLLAK